MTTTPERGTTDRRRRRLLSAAAALGGAALSGLPAGRSDAAPARAERPFPLPTRSRYVGMNLASITYWTTAFPFADLVKNGSGWSSRDSKGTWGATLATRPDGYPAMLEPGQRALLAVAWTGSRYPAGPYTVLWDGKGRIGFPLTRVAVRSSGPNKMTVEVAETGGPFYVAIEETDGADPVRNLRVLWPGIEPGREPAGPFNPAFLERLAPFSLLRFMDWGHTNGSPLVEWADRPRPTDLTYSTKGVPVEVMIDLANLLRADPWLCVPHQASDDYVRQLATLLRDRLDPALRLHVEYSNEVWNRGFPQSKWAVAQSERLGLARPSSFPSLFYAERSVAIFKLFAEVYGADRGRLVRVIAGQAAWTRFQESALEWRDTAAHADALAIAPYFKAETAGDPKNVEATLALSSDQVIDDMLANLRGKTAAAMRANAELARKHGLKLLGYEGGAHDTTSQFRDRVHQDKVATLFAAAHRHPRMRAVYDEYLELWIESGGELLAHYNDIGRWSKFGQWGALESLAQEPTESPKYRALLDVIARHPRS